MTFLRAASVCLLFSVTGCATDSANDFESDRQQYIIPMPPGGDCDEFGCGTNSPEIDHLGIHDLHGWVGGLENYNGFSVKSIKKAGVPYKRIYSKNGDLFVDNGAPPSVGASGTLIEVFNSKTSVKYEISIGDTSRVPFWGQITGAEVATGYLIGWKALSGPGADQKGYKNVCKKPLNDGSPDLLGMNKFHSVVFEDDEISAHDKTVKLRAEKDWFNIGCAGHALAKLHLTGYTSGAQHKYPGFHADARQRQATLKMITGDYCGTGYAFTVAGQPLGWTDLIWNGYTVGFAGKKESEWGEKGAACMNEPRLLANPPAVMPWPALLNDIKTECSGAPPPPCADVDPYSLDVAAGNSMISGNP